MLFLRFHKFIGLRSELLLLDRSLVCNLNRSRFLFFRLTLKCSRFPFLIPNLLSFQTLLFFLTNLDLLLHPFDWLLSDSLSLIKEAIPSRRTKYLLSTSVCSLTAFWRKGLTVSPLLSFLWKWSLLFYCLSFRFLFWLSFWWRSILYNLILLS